MESSNPAVGGWYRAVPPERRRRMVAIAVAALVVAGAGVAVFEGTTLVDSVDDGLDASSSPSAERAAGAADEAALSAPGPIAAQPAPAPGAPPVPGVPPVPGIEPRIVKHGELSLEVAEGSLPGLFDRVVETARTRGGFVVSSSTSSFDAGAARAQLTLRVPVEHFEAARGDLARLGEVHSVQVSGEDVTAQLVDLGARLRALRAEEEALSALLAEAGNVGEVLAVREQISATRMQIEQLAAHQASLEDRAAFSTLVVSLFEPGAAPTTSPPQPATGLARNLQQAVDGSLAVVGGMVVVLGYVLPVAALGLLAWGASRLVRLGLRRRPA